MIGERCERDIGEPNNHMDATLVVKQKSAYWAGLSSSAMMHNPGRGMTLPYNGLTSVLVPPVHRPVGLIMLSHLLYSLTEKLNHPIIRAYKSYVVSC